MVSLFALQGQWEFHSRMRKLHTWIIFFVSVGVLLALDLIFKHWAQANLYGQPPRVLIEGVLGLRYLTNPGAAFGFGGAFQHTGLVLGIIKALLLAAIIWYYGFIPYEKKFWFLRVPIILIFAGGLGNLFDRIYMRGTVRDMLEFLFMDFAIFNLADVYVTAGVFCLIFVLLFIVKDAPFLGRK